MLNPKASNISGATKLTHKAEQPRITDAIRDILDMMHELGADEELCQMVIDVSDAFWHVHNHPYERRFFVARVGITFIILSRTAQGSRNAALTWATVIALISRCVQSLFVGPHTMRSRAIAEMNLQV